MCVPEPGDAGVFFQNRPDDFPLDADSTAMDDAHAGESTVQGLVEVFLDHNGNLTGLEGMKVDGVLDRNLVHFDTV